MHLKVRRVRETQFHLNSKAKQILIRSLTITTLIRMYFSRQKRSICLEERWLRPILFTLHHHMGLGGDQAPIMMTLKIDLCAAEDSKRIANKSHCLSDQVLSLLQRLEEFISSKSRELTFHLSTMRNQTTTRSTGDSTSKTRTCSPTSTKQLTTVTK